MFRKIAVVAFALPLLAACNIKINSSLESLEGIGCTLRHSIRLDSSKMESLYDLRLTDVELDAEIETETMSEANKLRSKTLRFFQMYYTSADKSQLLPTHRAGARLTAGGDALGFADQYERLSNLSLDDSSANSDRLFRTSILGVEDVVSRTRPTTRLEVTIEDERLTAVALTVPVMYRNAGGTETYSYSGHNQKLCVLDATSF